MPTPPSESSQKNPFFPQTPGKRSCGEWTSVRLQCNSSGKASKVTKKVKVDGYVVVAEEIQEKETYGKLMDIVVKTAEKNTDAMKAHKPGDLVADTETYIPLVLYSF
jgi:hypothetical protein